MVEMKGIYFLLIKLEREQENEIGALGDLSFKGGYYIYIGSAQNGIEERVKRHLREEKSIYWHIDYFLEISRIDKVFYIRTNEKKTECKAANFFIERGEIIDNFGCSDCDCLSHLIYLGDEEKDAVEVIKSYHSIQELYIKTIHKQ